MTSDNNKQADKITTFVKKANKPDKTYSSDIFLYIYIPCKYILFYEH